MRYALVLVILSGCAQMPPACEVVETRGTMIRTPTGSVQITKTSTHALVCEPMEPMKNPFSRTSYLPQDTFPTEREK
jgi:hypothetical protein